MIIKERVWEEVYGGRHIFTANVNDLRTENFVSAGATKEGKIIFDYTMPGYLCKKDYMILKATKQEIEELRKISIQKIENKIEELKEEIEDLEMKYPIILQKTDIHFTKVIDKHRRRYDTHSPLKQGTVSMNMSIIDMIQAHYLHPNNIRSLYVLYGGFIIADKEIREFVKEISVYGSDAHKIIWIGEKFAKIKAYERKLEWAMNIIPTNIEQ